MKNRKRIFVKNRLNYTGAVLALAIALASTSLKGQTLGRGLDPSFGAGGIVTTDFAGGGDAAAGIAVQTDGKLVVAGNAFNNASSNFTFAVARYNSNGTLDASFGIGGKATTDVGGRFEFATAVAMQGDGKIVVAGNTVIGFFNDFALVRFNSNGTLDTSFGTGGKVLTDFGVSAQSDSIAVQPDGKILVAGFANLDGGDNFEVVRYNSDGTLDTSFGTGGKVTTDFGLSTQGFSFAQANSLAVQQDGKIVLAGMAVLNSVRNFAVVRYNSNGTLDAGFGNGGKVTTPFATPNPSSDNVSAESVAVQPDGKIVAAGLAGFDVALARYNSNGTIDPGFGTGGKVTTSISPSYDSASSVSIQRDGKIVVAGRTVTLSDGNFHSLLVRYNSNGMLDTAFGAGGNLTNIFGGDNEAVSSIAIQLDGKIVAAGGVTVNGNSDFALARFNSENDSTAPAPASATASFVKLDTTTGGSWKGVYGLDGYAVINDSASAPVYGTAMPAGVSSYTWAASTSDVRGLQKGASPNDRIAACFYSSGTFSIDLHFNDMNTHQVAFYFLDWDFYGPRNQQVDILDPNTGVLLDSREVSSFAGGQYLVWNLSGHVIVRITNLKSGSNAVLSAIFFR
jgi:uncharacterized delta-60 repeat protein